MKGEHYRLYGRKSYLKNKEKWKATRSRYVKAHRAEAVKRTQAYVARHYDRVATYNSQFGRSIEGKYRLLKYRHNKRGWTDRLLSLPEFTTLYSMPCAYCSQNTKGGIDRADNNIGYSLSNCLPCCELCNHMKWKLSKPTFIAHIKRIASNV